MPVIAFFGFVSTAKGHRLLVSAVPTINRNSFASKLISQFIGLIDISFCNVFGEVYGLADRCVAVLLKDGLHANMPFRADIVGTFEDFTNLEGYFRYFLNAAISGDLTFELFIVKTTFFSYVFENRIYLQ